MSAKIKYGNEPIEIGVIRDFPPNPEKLAFLKVKAAARATATKRPERPATKRRTTPGN